ncbi:MAG: hypothetical protein EU536_01280 [Promethearchaeota archaeon]|nr:MAG: hypothetical protein EU536_01280 [Candidatus Lokiarchaeota archaeon]
MVIRIGAVNQVILLVIDDLRSDHLKTLLAEGKLPNIQKYLGGGITSEHNIAGYPAITFPAQSTMLTGMYPDSYQFPGGHWVKRDEQIIRNYNSLKEFDTANKELGSEVKTIFELVPGKSAGLSLGLSRGASYVYPTKNQIIFLYIWYMVLLRKKLLYLNTLITNKMLKFLNKKDPPQLTVCWFLTTDNALHNYGADSNEYLHSIQDIDAKIGELINGNKKWKGLKQLGYFDDTALILTSDHGNYAAKKWIDIAPFFEQIGLRPLIPTKSEGNFDATMGSLCFFTLRGNSWLERPSIAQMQTYGPQRVNLFETLMQIPGARYLYYREDGNTFNKGIIHVLKKEGAQANSATIEYHNDRTKLENDIYGYSADQKAAEMLDGKFHSIDEWLAHTHQVDFPIIVDQVCRLFRNPNSCDIMLSTCGETIFNYEHGITKNGHIHGHDIGLKRAMTVPLLISGPQIPEKRILYSKSTDLVPTILKLLGLPIPSSIIGTSLI